MVLTPYTGWYLPSPETRDDFQGNASNGILENRELTGASRAVFAGSDRMLRVKKSQSKWYFALLTLVFSLGCMPSAHGFFGLNPYWALGGFDVVRWRSGHVMARSVILTDNGYPTYVEFDEAGEEAREIAEASGKYLDASLMSGYRYRDIVKNFNKVDEDYGETIARGAYVLSRDAYQSMQFTTRDGKPLSNVPQLQESTLSVLVRHQDQILIENISPVLFEAPVDLSDPQDVPEEINSLLISKEGRVLDQAEGTIGFKSGYFKGDEDGFYWSKSLKDNEVYSGIPNVTIEIPAGNIHGYGVTDEDGFYHTVFLLVPCPGFYFDYTVPIYAKMRYRMFNPRSARHNNFHMVAPSYDACNGYSIGRSVFPNTRTNFLVDTAMLSGQGYLANPAPGTINTEGEPVPIGASTAYEFEEPELKKVVQENYDFDGDDEPDRSVLGKLEEIQVPDGQGSYTTEERFVRDDEGSLQGVYLSSGNNNPDLPVTDEGSQPDFVRLADREQDYNHQGLLETISEEDYKDTDLYVFRQSNGMLITHRRGLRDNEFAIRSNDGVDTDEEKIFYQMLVRGPKTRNGPALLSSLYLNFSEFQSRADMNPALHAREADHLRPEEPISIIAINRKTGYIGRVDTAFMDYSQPGLISIDIDQLVMRPPNLKVKAERQYTVDAGLTKGDENEYLIGYEGAATTSDTIITITTEWFDHDGSPLPEELGEYGYTGRLAKITGNKTVSTDGGQLAQFPIKPGQHLQTVRLKGDYASSEHFYVQINGEPENENPDFSTTGAAEDGPLMYRPKHYVPFLVPLLDEDSTIRQYNEYRKLKRDENVDNSTLYEQEPIYQWFYRPEMQFSLYDLEMENIYRIADEETNDAIDILPEETPTIASSDDIVRLAYSMVEQQFEAMPFLGSGQQLVFAFGEEEIEATLDSNANIVFTNLEHFAALDPEDFLSIRLYSNNDSANVLWEYAFGVDAIPLIDTLEISVDEETMDFSVFFPLLEDDEELTLRWRANGTQSTAMEKSTTSEASAIHSNVLKLGTEADTLVMIEVDVLRSSSKSYQQGAKWSFGPYKTLPGEPKSMTTSPQIGEEAATVPADTVSQIELSATLRDQFGNLVLEGTPVSWSLDDSAELKNVVSETDAEGVVTALYIVDEQASTASVDITSGDATGYIEVTKTPLTIQLSASQSSVQSGGEQFITLTATITGSTELEGIPVSWTSTDGSLSAYSTAITGNTATVYLYSSIAPGSATVSASIPGFASEISVNFTPSDLAVAELELPSIVNAPMDGIVTVETLKGQASHSFVTSTDLIIYGEPGRTMSISPGSIYAPNGRQTHSFSLSDLLPSDENSSSPYIQDNTGSIIAKSFGSVELEIPDEHTGLSQSYEGSGSSVAFNGGYFKADDVSVMHLQNDLFLNVRFYPESIGDNQTLIQKVGGNGATYKLELVTDLTGVMFLEAMVTTDEDTYSLRSEVPIDAKEWYIGGIQLKDGVLTLALDDERYTLEVAGTLQHNGDDLYIGSSGFRGYMDDIRLGSVADEHQLLSMSQSNVVIGSDGTGRVRMQAIGNAAQAGQKVGFTVTEDSGLTGGGSYELKLYQPLPDRIRQGEEVAPMQKMLAFLGISSAHASIHDPRGCNRRVACRQARESGVLLTNEDTWGSVREVIAKRLLNDQIVDAVKKTSQFIFELTSINDVWIIIRSLYHLGTGQLDKIEGFELTFAVIGVGVTIFAVVSSGGAALLPMKAALTSFKGLLKAFWVDIGGAMLTKGLVSSAKYMWTNIKLFVNGQRTLASENMADFALAMGKMINNASRLIGPFFRNVRSVDDLVFFIKFAKKDTCLSAPALSGDLISVETSIASSWSFSFFPNAYAAPDCFSKLNALANIASDTVKYGEYAHDVEKAVFSLAKSEKLETMTVEEFNGLAQVAYQHVLRRPLDKFASRANKGVKFFDEDVLKKGLRGINGLALDNLNRPATAKIPGYEGFVSKFATLQRYQNDPIGTLHAVRSLENLGFNNVLAFERKMKDIFPEINPINTKADGTGVDKFRRVDAHVKDDKNLEFKGSAKDSGSYRMSKSEELEFLNDAIYFSRAGQEFEWQIARQLDIKGAENRMKELLGDGDIPDGLDDRLYAYVKELRKNDEVAADAMEIELAKLYKKLSNGEIIRQAEYVD
ncbi:Ig-like domain-containing protein [Microbulbifer sp. JMSA003]|uniref:Ig-like domain-containing protein n=1 Tax=Microbulbifer sp. JMSA003 TaxID=3243369 RepID=UPI004039AE17